MITEAAPAPSGTDALAAALREETRLIRAMADTFRGQREAIARDDADAVGDSTFAANRILHTMGEARRRRRALLARLTGAEDVDLFGLEAVLGPRMSDELRNARDELGQCAGVLSEEVALNRSVLRAALAAGEQQIRMLCGAAVQAVGYGSDARPRDGGHVTGALVNRTA